MNLLLQLLVLLSPFWGPFVLMWAVKDLDREPFEALRLFLTRLEGKIIVAVLAVMVALPVVSILGRVLFDWSSAGPNLWVQHLNLVLAFVGAVVAARTGRHLSLSTGELLRFDEVKLRRIKGFTSAVATAVTVMLAYAAVEFVRAEIPAAKVLPGDVPIWLLQLFMPLGFLGMALYLAWVGNPGWKGRTTALVASLAVAALVMVPAGSRSPVVWLGGAVLLAAVSLGAPIYTVIGGMAMLLFYGQPNPTPISAVPLETFTLVANPTLAAIPLFTLAGYLLAEGGSSKRLVELFRCWFGWLPGGIGAAAVLVCAFFTTFTGASGVTILALGGLLLPSLLKAGYSERFSIGLLIASGSIGLLFPPSLPVILYGVTAKVPIDKLFISGAVPGILLVLLLAGASVVHAVRNKIQPTPLDLGAAARSLWRAKWEATLPILVLVGIFGLLGERFAVSIFEAAGATAAYAFFIEVVIHRDLKLKTDIPRIFVECGTLMGGVLIILGVALGLTNFLVDAEVPMLATKWAQAHIGSKLVFILALNLFLLVVGCLMDIFSAIVVVVPLIVPIALVFGMDPIHLGVLFLANLELGYLTPPVGMNLFLGAYRFDKPVTEMYKVALPFLVILAVGVLLIAYVPSLTTWSHDAGDTSNRISFEDELLELDDLPALGAEEPVGNPLPLGKLDLNALLAADDDISPLPRDDEHSSVQGDDDSATGSDEEPQ